MIGLISIFSLVLPLADAVASPHHEASMVQSDDDDAMLYKVIPELTNPAEVPIAETPIIESEPTLGSPLAWFQETIKGTQTRENDNDSHGNVDTTLKQWLSSINSVLEGQ